MLAEVTGGRGNAVAFVAPDDRRLTTGIGPPGQQRPLSLFLRQAVDSCIARKVENQAVLVATVGLGAQAAAYHLQVQRKALGGASDDYAGSVGKVEPLGGDGYVDQHPDGPIAERFDGPSPFFRRRVAEHDGGGDSGAVEYRCQVVGVALGDGVDDGEAFCSVELPEAERSRGHDVGAVLVGPLDSRFVVVACGGNRAAAYHFFRRRHKHIGFTQPAVSPQLADLGATVKLVEQMVEPFGP